MKTHRDSSLFVVHLPMRKERGFLGLYRRPWEAFHVDRKRQQVEPAVDPMAPWDTPMLCLTRPEDKNGLPTIFCCGDAAFEEQASCKVFCFAMAEHCRDHAG
jgi:hypothetical protein